MDNESEVIRQQMEETRASLAEKLETLEQQVVGTVQGTTAAVTETVDTVKEGVQETVETVKNTVQEAVGAVKETFDIPRQVERHPWAMMGGAVALGYVAGYLYTRSQDRSRMPGWASSPSLRESGWSTPAPERSLAPQRFEDRPVPPAPSPPEPPRSSWLSELNKMFGNEINQLKGLAIGAAMGIVRDMVTRSAPPQLEGQLTNMMDSITNKLGGQPMEGPVLNFDDNSAHSGVSHERHYAEMGRPLGSAQR
jgi:ElaB/YqjD/DUF883 family membrane-anchored ribosome-binding protein